MRQLKLTQSITSRDSQSMNAYLREIDRYKLLTPDEEIELAQRIHKGDMAARDELVNANLRFVVSVANQCHCTGIDQMDLISEGNMGLVKAAEKFDETRGFKFISYAVWWIRQAIMQAVSEQSRLVRIPLNKQGDMHRIAQFVAEFEQSHQYRPSIDQIAEGTGMDVERVGMMMGVSSRHTSIDSPLKDGEDGTMLDVLPNDNAERTDQSLEGESLRHEVSRILSTLNDRERAVLTMCYGLDHSPMTLEEISISLGLTRERVRQIRENAIRRLRHNSRNVLLKQFL